MAKGTVFNTIHSFTDLHLIQQSVNVQPAKPKLNLVDVPGSNGSKDLTEALGVGVKYNDLEITWTFALYPGDDWAEKQMQVSNAINGIRCPIFLDCDNGEWYYIGRVSVEEYKSDKLLHQITVRAVCSPYKKRSSETVVQETLTAEEKVLALSVGAMPLVPTITNDVETTIAYNGATVTLPPGTHVLPTLRMKWTANLTAKTTSGTGTITVTWREGSL